MAWPVEYRNEDEWEMCFETSRFLSFRTFPQNVNVSGLRLANNGFYFTGRDAIVRCFSCHRYHSDWQTDGVLYQVGYWMHEEDCAFMLEMDSSNVPMHRQPGENQHLTNSHLLLGLMAHGLRYMDQGITGM